MADGNYDALISGSELNERWRSMLTRYIKKQCGDDEELFKNILPDYPPYCSRVLVDNDWVQTLKRDNVNLIPNQVDRINARSLEAGGKEYDADIIIYSTGFKSNDFLFPMHVERDGVDIRQKWKDNGGAVAYKGVTVPGLPNFFMCYGPNTNLGHGGSIIFHSECQIRYIMGAIEKLNEMGAHGISLDVKEDKCEEYNQSAYSQLDKTVWGDAGCTSWYKTKDGRIVNNSPWTLLDYYTLTKEFDVQNYNISTSQNSSSKL
jgi:4-hydroxyacetophenone monooxygenase